MLSSAPTRPLRLPPADLARKNLPQARLPARVWSRVHPASQHAIAFGLNPAHRFSHPDCPFKFLYVGTDLATCLWERFGDTVFDQDHRVAKTIWMETNISMLKLPPLQVCDLGKTEVRNALRVDLTALMSPDLSVPQSWGLAIQRHPAKFLAIKYNSRFNNLPCLALFDRGNVQNSLDEKSRGPLGSSSEALDWLEKFEIQLV
jgi:hypothetical protein